MVRHKRQSAYLHRQEDWKKLYESGMSFTQIGKNEGLSYQTVQIVLKDVITPRPKQKFAHLAKEWVELYEVNGFSTTQIAEKYNTDVTTVSKYLKQEGVELRKHSGGKSSKFEKFVPTWVAEYESGKSLREIAEEYQTYPQTVHSYIKDKTVMREYTETSQQYDIKHPDFLKEINTHEKAYWLGVWLGSGFLSKRVGGFECTLVVAEKDADLVYRFKELIGYEKPVLEIQEDNTNVKKIRIHNKLFFEILSAHGLFVDKTSSLRFPETLQPEFYNSFLLGYYEAKGSGYISNSVTKGKVYSNVVFQIFGNEEFLKTVRTIFFKEIGVDLNKGVTEKGDRDPVNYLITGAREKVVKIAKWLYKDVPIYLEHRDIRVNLKNVYGEL